MRLQYEQVVRRRTEVRGSSQKRAVTATRFISTRVSTHSTNEQRHPARAPAHVEAPHTNTRVCAHHQKYRAQDGNPADTADTVITAM